MLHRRFIKGRGYGFLHWNDNETNLIIEKDVPRIPLIQDNIIAVNSRNFINWGHIRMSNIYNIAIEPTWFWHEGCTGAMHPPYWLGYTATLYGSFRIYDNMSNELIFSTKNENTNIVTLNNYAFYATSLTAVSTA